MNPRGFGSQVLRGVFRYAEEHRHFRLCNAMSADDTVYLKEVRPDGVIAQVASPRLLASIESAGVLAVNVSSVMQSGLPLVAIDNFALGKMAAEHLLDRGYTRLACVTNVEHHYARLRCEGFCAVARAADVECIVVARGEILSLPCGPADSERMRRDACFSMWLKSLPTPIAVFSAADFTGVSPCALARLAGRSVPDEMAFLAVGDDAANCEFDTPPLSSVDYPGTQIGYEAARLLDRMLSGEEAPKQPILLPPTGVSARASTARFMFTDPDVAQAMQFIQKSACRGIGVGELCDAIAVSRRTLQRRFQQLLGRSPLDEILRVRMQHARRLVVDTDLGPEAIARECGMKNAYRLCHCFKRHFGISPMRYRQRQRGVR